MQKFFFLCVFLCAVSTKVTAQDCEFTFKGKIIDFHDKTPIVGASVAILNLKKYTTSDLDGNFEINKLCKGKIIVEVRHISCDTKQITLNLNESISKEIFLEHHLEKLNEIVVKTNKKTEQTSVEQTIKKEVIADFTDKSLGDVLNTVSGVSSLNTGNAIVKPMIHGLHSSRLLIINNNVRQYDQEWGAEHAPNIDINASDRIDIVKGANTLMYGSDAIGGLILIRPDNYAAKDSLFGSTSTSLNSNGNGGNINSKLIKTFKSGFYTKLQANYRMFGDFNAANYNLSNSGIKNINASTRFGYKSFEKGFDVYYSYVDNTIGIIRAAHVGNVNDLVNAINRKEPSFIDDFTYTIDNPKQTIIHHLAKLEAYKRFKGLGKLTLQYDFQLNRRKEFDRRRASFRDLAAADFTLFTTSFQPNLKIDAIDNLEINSGFLLRFQQNDSADESITRISIPLIPDYDKYETGIYTIAKYKFNATTEISAGLRYDFARIEAEKKYKVFDWEENNYDELFPEFSSGIVDNFEIFTSPKFNFNNFSASLGLSQLLKNDFKLLFNYGLASRTPNVSELFSNGLHHSAARIETGSLLLKNEVANNFIASFERNSDSFGFSISPYYKYIKDFIQLIPNGKAVTTIRGAFTEWQYYQINAQIFGVDIDINKKISDSFQYSGSLSLLQGDNLTDKLPLIHMPATNFSNRLIYTNPNLNQLKIGIHHKTVLQQKRFPDYNFFTFNAISQEDVLVDISTTPPTYSLFGLNTSAVFNVFKQSRLQVEFNIENMFNVEYREHLNRLRYFADDLGRNYNLKIKLNY